MTIQDFCSLERGDRVVWCCEGTVEGTVTVSDGGWITVVWDDGMTQSVPVKYPTVVECFARWMERASRGVHEELKPSAN